MAKKLHRNEQASWEALQNPWGLSKTRTMKEVVESFMKYVATYDKQYGYENFHDETFIDDILYGLGRALGEKYEYATGFERFKEEVLIPHLGIRDAVKRRKTRRN